MKAYKGFDKDMKCRGFQYEEGKSYETDTAELCKSGFHACEAPIDVLRYYPPCDDGKMSNYHEVELEDVSSERQSDDDTKVCAKKITIGAKLNLFKIAELQVEYVKSKCVPSKSHNTKGDRKSARSTGDRSANSATGDGSANSATGDGSANSATGDRSANSATGDGSANSATGDGSANSATGYGSANISTGTGCKNEGKGEANICVAWGKDSACKGVIGTHLVLSEWGDWDGKKYPFISAVMVVVDGEKIKADTEYMLKDGKVVEVKYGL